MDLSYMWIAIAWMGFVAILAAILVVGLALVLKEKSRRRQDVLRAEEAENLAPPTPPYTPHQQVPSLGHTSAPSAGVPRDTDPTAPPESCEHGPTGRPEEGPTDPPR